MWRYIDKQQSILQIQERFTTFAFALVSQNKSYLEASTGVMLVAAEPLDSYKVDRNDTLRVLPC